MMPKKTCNEDQLVLYHYAELSTAECRDFEAHLQNCPGCQGALRDLQEGLAAIAHPELQLSDAQKQRFVAQVSERTQRRPVHLGVAWGGVLATAALVAGIMLLRPADLPVPVTPGEPAIADFEMLEQLDLLQDLELLKDLDLLQELESFG